MSLTYDIMAAEIALGKSDKQIAADHGVTHHYVQQRRQLYCLEPARPAIRHCEFCEREIEWAPCMRSNYNKMRACGAPACQAERKKANNRKTNAERPRACRYCATPLPTDDARPRVTCGAQACQDAHNLVAQEKWRVKHGKARDRSNERERPSEAKLFANMRFTDHPRALSDEGSRYLPRKPDQMTYTGRQL